MRMRKETAAAAGGNLLKLGKRNGMFYSLALVCLLSFFCMPELSAQQSTDDIDNPEELYSYAAGLVERKFYDLSLEQLNKFKQRYPDHKYISQVYQLLIFCNNATRRSEDTRKLMAEFKKRWPDSPMNENFVRMCAATAFEDRNFAAAGKYYDRLQSSKDQAVAEEAVYYSAQCAESLGQKDRAFQLMKKLAGREFDTKFPYRPYSAYYVSMKLLESDRLQEALPYLRRLSQGKAIPEKLLEESLERSGDVLYRMEKYGDALAFYSEYLVRFGNHARAKVVRRQRILCCYELGQYSKVREYYKDWRLSHLEDNDYELDFIQASSLSQLGFYEEAFGIFVEIGRNKANDREIRRRAQLSAIECLQFLNRDQDMLRHAQDFLTEYPNFPEKAALFYRMGYAAMRMKRYEDAEKYLRSARDLFVGDPVNIQSAALLLTDALDKQKKYSEAAAVLRALSAEDLEAEVRAELLTRAGRYEWQVPAPEKARADMNLVLVKFPGNRKAVKEALSVLIDIDISQRKFKPALEHLEKYYPLASEQEKSKLEFLMAWCHSDLNEYSRAIQVLKKSVSSPSILNDQRVTSMVFLIQILSFRRKIQESAPYVRQLLEMNDSKALRRELNGQVLAALGRDFIQVDNFKLAEELWSRLLKTEKDIALRSEAYLGLARIDIALNRLNEAERLLSELSREREAAGVPEDKEQLSLMAEVYLLRKNYSRALIFADKSMSAGGGDARSVVRARWVKAAVLYEDEKDYKNALPYCIKCYVLADDPVYSSRAMMLAIRILVQQEKFQEASATWQELQNRYPVKAAAYADDAVLKKIKKK